MKLIHYLSPIVLSSTLLVASSSSLAESKNTQEIMWQLYDAIAYLLPLSVTDKASFSDVDEALLNKHLADLKAGANKLADHGAAGPARGFSSEA